MLRELSLSRGPKQPPVVGMLLVTQASPPEPAVCGPALPPSGRARAVPRAHSTPIHLIVQNVLSVCRGPDTALTARDPSGTKADVARPLWGLRGQRPSVWPVVPCMRSHSADFPVLTAVSFQTLPFVARLNSSMGPGRTVVIKGEVNTKAKGLVSRSCQK